MADTDEEPTDRPPPTGGATELLLPAAAEQSGQSEMTEEPLAVEQAEPTEDRKSVTEDDQKFVDEDAKAMPSKSAEDRSLSTEMEEGELETVSRPPTVASKHVSFQEDHEGTGTPTSQSGTHLGPKEQLVQRSTSSIHLEDTAVEEKQTSVTVVTPDVDMETEVEEEGRSMTDVETTVEEKERPVTVVTPDVDVETTVEEKERSVTVVTPDVDVETTVEEKERSVAVVTPDVDANEKTLPENTKDGISDETGEEDKRERAVADSEQMVEHRDMKSDIPPINFRPDFSAFEVIDVEQPEQEDDLALKSETHAIQGLLDELEDGQSDLDSDMPPPPLFSRPEHRSNREKLADLKTQISEPRGLGEYLDEFDDVVKDDVLLIGNISLEDIQEEERRLRDEHIAYQKQEASLQKERLQELLQKEEQAKLEVANIAKDKKKAIQKRETMNLQRDRLQHDMLQKSYRRAEQQMLATLKRRKAEVKTMYGDLEVADGQYGGSKGRRWKVDWSKTPQPIQVKLKCLRAVKDKLPAGRYIMMVSLYDRLGGHVLRWSELKGQQWGGATLPVQHDGHYHNIELKLDQSVFTVCPAKPDIRPAMVLMFELFLLRGAVTPTDRVVAWGTFPISDAEFNIVEGKYKCCMLRGDIDPSIDKHEKLEELMARDLENWLCNLYFDVLKLPRYLAGQKEYEVELQFTSGLLGFPDRLQDTESAVDGNDPVVDQQDEVREALGGSRNSLVSGGSSQEEAGQLRLRTAAAITRGDLSTVRPETSVRQSRRLVEGGDSSDSDDELLDDDENTEFTEQNGQPGLYYKLHTRNPADRYYKQVYTMLPKTPMLKKRKKKALSHLEELENHSISVKPPFSAKGRDEKRSSKKIQYVGRQLLAEMGLSQWRSREFWGMIIMLICVFWIRLYLHYIGQWLFLSGIQIPVNKFEFLAYTVFLRYQSSLLFTREEFAVVVIGPMTNVVVFALFIMMAWAAQRVFGSFPNILSRFIVAFGIETALDLVLVTIVDMAMGRYQNQEGTEPIADAAKLYWHFFRLEGNGLAGIFLTLFVYFFIMFVAIACLYMYFLKLHMNGRMLDIYHRLHGSQDDFFVPFDLEISNEELSYIVKKAEQWRGEEGERRKTAVYDYVWEEEQVGDNGNSTSQQGRRETTSHVSIYTIHLDGLRQLYRHFLRLQDGAIVEVFGDVGSVGQRNVDNKLQSRLPVGEGGSREQLFTVAATDRGLTPLNSTRATTCATVRQHADFLSIPEHKYGKGTPTSPV